MILDVLQEMSSAPFQKPTFSYSYQVTSQIQALRDYRRNKPGRQISAQREDRLLLATWNIANLGLQERRQKDYRLIAEMIGWFDLVAVQEVHDNLAGLGAIQKHLPPGFQALFSDIPGKSRPVWHPHLPRIRLRRRSAS